MRTFFKFILVLLILTAGGLISWKLVKTKPKVARKPISIGSPLVETLPAISGTEQVRIIAMGTVIPAKEVVIRPQVSGYITEISAGLIPGGRFKAGDMLLRIDDRDYKIAVDQRKAEVSRALMDLKMEKGRKTIAEREWDLLSSEISATDAGRELALRNPQLKKAVAALESVRSALRKAMLDAERTEIKAPFNSFVKEKYVDIGQPVTSGTNLVTLTGTDEFWVRISVPVSRLPWISIPQINGSEGSPATVIQENRVAERHGRVVRLLGDLDPVGRMARLLISVEDPFGIHLPSPAPVPLLLGAYVTVKIQGPQLTDIFVIPRKALREGDQVWVMTDKNRLAVRTAEVIWRRKADVLVRGLKPDEQIITSRISSPVPGMKLRVQSRTKAHKIKPPADPSVSISEVKNES